MVKLHILNATGSLTPYLSKIEKNFNQTKDKIEKQIPIENVDVVVVDNAYMTIPEVGILGYTYGKNFITIYLDSKFKNFEKVLSEDFCIALAHEALHATRWQNYESKYNLLTAIINEGLADHFSIQITNCKPQLWSKSLNKAQIDLMLKKVNKFLSSTDHEINRSWMFGNKKDIPRWTGYSLGFYLIERYLKSHLNETAASLYNVKAQEFTADL